MFANITERIREAASTTSDSSTAEQANNMLNFEEENRVIDRHLLYGDEQKLMEPMTLPTIIKSKGIGGHRFTPTSLLERPVKIVEYTWSSTQSAGTLLGTVNPIDEISKDSYFADKFSSHRFLTTNLDIYVKVNPQPFHQGALMISTTPYNGNPAVNTIPHSYYPHVLLNITAMNNAKIELGFLEEYEAYDLLGVINRGFNLNVKVVSELAGATLPVDLQVEIYAMLKNPVLSLPMAQSGESDLAENAETGLVTKISGAVADSLELAQTALSQIPVIGTFVPPLTWTARAFNKVSAYFGWSKPINVEVAKNVCPAVAWRMCNGEGVDNSVALAISPDNAIDSAENSIFKLDEMDFSYLLERKVMTKVTSIDKNTNPVKIDLGQSQEVLTPADLVLNCFNYWRFSVKFEINLVKTRFHTGRLIVQYYPAQSAEPTTNLIMERNMNKLYTKVIDISEVDRFYFTVPYMHNQPYRMLDESFGSLYIGQLTQLDYPDTVSPNVGVIVYRAISDCEVSAPMFKPFPSISRAQGCCDNTEPIIADDLIPVFTHDFSKEIGGEKVSNLRTLAKRFTQADTISAINQAPYLISDLGHCLFQNINNIYAFRSGSIRFKFIFPRKYCMRVELIHKGYDISIPAVWAHPEQWFVGHMNNFAEITVPYYNSVRRSGDEYPWHTVKINLFDSDTLKTTPLQGDERIYIYAAAGDDYSGYFPMPI
jgi:hypothetical protein